MKRLFGSSPSPPSLALALQGGGAHGAFTWGVLDALLEDGRFDFDALSGTSSGAMNAVVLAHGLTRGGRRSRRYEKAREDLANFWSAISTRGPTAFVQGDAESINLSPTGKWLVDLTHWISPYNYNPFELNPLRDIVEKQIDFARLRRQSACKLFIAATQTDTGRLTVFREHELTADHLLASACLPNMHHAVVIDGEAYWDGAFSANPAVFPLLQDTKARDVLLVLLAPMRRDHTPRLAAEIHQRKSELAFSTPLLREMQLLGQVSRIAAQGLWSIGTLERRLRGVRWHLLEASELDALQRTDTKLIAEDGFLLWLRDQGRLRAQQWVAEHAADIGRRTTVDISSTFA